MMGTRVRLCALLALGVACNGAIEPGDARLEPSAEADSTANAGGSTDADPAAPTDIDAGTDAGSCAGGPLATPLVGCSPERAPSTGDWQADCVARINQLRWECQCLPPLEHWVEGEACADANAEYDSENGVHASFRDMPCSTGARAQNECPGWPSNEHIVDGCLQSMWDEGPEDGNPNTINGHYESMASTTYSSVACGFHTTPSGEVWGVQNFR